MRALKKRTSTWLSRRGSTRAAALIRIGLAFLLWLTWGDDLALFRSPSIERIAVSLAFYVSTAMMLVGLRARWAAFASAAVASYVYSKLGVLDGNSGFVHHHTMLLVLATFICALSPCGGSFSLDRWLGQRRENPGSRVLPELGATWAVSLYGVLVSSVYLGGAVSKTNAGWLSGDRLEQIFAHYYGFSNYPETPWIGRLFLVATISVVALEYALVVGLWFHRTRRLLIPIAIGLHVGFYLLLPVETFSLTMLLLYLSFAPKAVHDSIGTLAQALHSG